MFDSFISFVRRFYGTENFIALHEPCFSSREKELVLDCIDSTFVSSVGKYVDEFEEKIAEYTGARHAVAVVNGTQALFLALKLLGVGVESEVITQSLTFIATANAINYTGASPIFIDVDQDTMGMSPVALRSFLETSTYKKKGRCYNPNTKRQIHACVPMHTCGHPCRIDEINEICEEFGIITVEDAAESLGSFYKGKHTGLFGKLGVLSFNGNKILTTGGGGVILTNDMELAKRAKHISTTAKLPHPWEFRHDEIGYNFRMPNINAALGVAQMERLPEFVSAKRGLAKQYAEFLKLEGFIYKTEPENAVSNYWLNAIQLENKAQRDSFLEFTNKKHVMTRPLWHPMHRLPMYSDYQKGDLPNTDFLFERIVNIPSSVKL